jgi:hypothetical protein
MSGCIRHAPPTTGTTDAPFLAGIRNKPVHAAVLAVDAQEAVRQNSTLQELPEFAFHEAWDVAVVPTLTGKESLQMAGDEFIERIVLWIARPVGDVDSHEGAAGCKAARN